MDLQQLAGQVAGMAFGHEPARISETRLLPGNSALVYRFEYALKNRRQSVYVKLPHETSGNLEETRRLHREFRITRAVKTAFPETPALRTVAPVGLLQNAAAFATWEIPGISLQYLLNSRLRFRRSGDSSGLMGYMELAGDWLKRFHALPLTGDAPDPDRILDYCRKRLDTLVSLRNSGVSEAKAEALEKVIAGWTHRLSGGTEFRAGLCHNDYSPHNIMVTLEGICVLDFSFSAPGFKVFDLACFWHKLEDLKSSPLYSGRAVERLQERFLDAYGTELDTTRPDTALGLMRLVLSKMAVLCEFRSLRPDRWLETRRRYSTYSALLDSWL
jgi:aminoglycoside phosphotransferase (APT) family kinase protein